MTNPTTRVYLVESIDGSERHLVEAALPRQAEWHVCGTRYKQARLPTQRELIQLTSAGTAVQQAAGEEQGTAIAVKAAIGNLDAHMGNGGQRTP